MLTYTMYLVGFVAFVCIVYLIIRLRKTRKLLNTYRKLYHEMKHEISTPLSVLESSYEMAFGEYGEVIICTDAVDTLTPIKKSIEESLTILRKYSKKSDKLKEIQ